MRVLHGKGDQARTVALDPGALALVERWLTERRKLGITSRRRLFCPLAGAPLDSSYVRQLLPRLAAKAGSEKRVHAHGFRHTHAAELAREGQPINRIRDQLGHRSLAHHRPVPPRHCPPKNASTPSGPHPAGGCGGFEAVRQPVVSSHRYLPPF